LLSEVVIVLGVVVLIGFLVYHFTVHTIRNTRTLAGANVDVSSAQQTQSEASFSIDPSHPQVLFGATNDTGRETVRVHVSANGGRTWRGSNAPAVSGGSCAHGQPRTAIDRSGRQYLAFLAASYCGDSLTPYLVVTSRDSSAARWSPLVRVTAKAWKFGFDDWPALAVDERSGRLYLAWSRSLSASKAVIVVSASDDRGRTWSRPHDVSRSLEHPHLASIAVAPGGDVYVAGIDAKLGVWITRSTDGGGSFAAPSRASPLLDNPAGECSLAGASPLPREETTCFGPDPTVLAGRDRVLVVYDDQGSNKSVDVYAAVLSPGLRPLARVRVNPPDAGNAQQFFPAAALDASTGVAWACWFDTTFDSNAHRAWFTCSASKNGSTWAPPLAASSAPTPPPDLLGAAAKLGLTPSVAAFGGTAHAFWPDGRIIDNGFDVFTAGTSQGRALTPR
jgi:hypothetical protein